VIAQCNSAVRVAAEGKGVSDGFTSYKASSATAADPLG
jgi:hypothetical protein